jgi:hypothetical protein
MVCLSEKEEQKEEALYSRVLAVAARGALVRSAVS